MRSAALLGLIVALWASCAQAAIGTPAVIGSGTDSGSTSSFTITTTAGVLSTDQLIVCAASSGGSVGVSAPSATGVTFNSGTQSGPTNTQSARCFWANPGSTLASGSVVTITYSTLTTHKLAYVIKVTGLDATTPHDQTGSPGSGASTAILAIAVTPAVTPSLVLGIAVVASNGSADTYTVNNGFTQVAAPLTLAFTLFRLDYLITSSAGAQTYSVTDNTSSRTWLANTEVFKGASGAPAANHNNLLLMGVGK